MELSEVIVHEATKASPTLSVLDESGAVVPLTGNDAVLSVIGIEFPGDPASLLFSLDTVSGGVSIVDAANGIIQLDIPETAIPQRFSRREGRIEVRTHEAGDLAKPPTRRLVGRLQIRESIA